MDAGDELLVGLIPAAGLAKRVSPLPGSKELFPVGFHEVESDGHVRLCPTVVSQYLLDNMRRAGAMQVWMVLGKGKWDIVQYFGDGSEFGVRIAYLVMDRLWGMPYTLDQAWPWIADRTVLFGMPDTIFTPPDAFARLVSRHRDLQADVTLGVFPTDQPQRLSPVQMEADGRVLAITDKPAHTSTMNTWGCACWSPRFSRLMHDYLGSIAPPQREVVLADVFQHAMAKGLRVYGLFFADGEYIDIGTPDDLVVAVRRFSQR
jgi:glucose-1-phosphate thymidylyltransferase